MPLWDDTAVAWDDPVALWDDSTGVVFAITRVQTTDGSAAGTTASVAYTSPIARGNLLVAFVAINNATPAVPVVTDTLNNNWTFRASTVFGAITVFLFDCLNSNAAGADTVTAVGNTGTTKIILGLLEYNNNAPNSSWFFDQFKGSQANSTNPTTGVSGTPFNTTSVVFSMAATLFANGIPITAGSGGSWVGNATADNSCWLESRYVSSKITLTAAYTSASVSWAALEGIYYSTVQGAEVVQEITQGHGSPMVAATTQHINLRQNTVTGNMLIVTVGINSNNTVTGITISGGSATFSKITSKSNANSAPTEIWAAANITGGTTPIITVALSASTTCNIGVLEVTGMPATITTSGTPASGAATSTAISSGAITTTYSNCLIVATGNCYGNTNVALSGWSGDLGTNNPQILYLAAPAGTYTASATQTSSNPWTMCIAAFQMLPIPNPILASCGINLKSSSALILGQKYSNTIAILTQCQTAAAPRISIGSQSNIYLGTTTIRTASPQVAIRLGGDAYHTAGNPTNPNATNLYLNNSMVTGYPFSIVGWYKPDYLWSDSGVFYIGDNTYPVDTISMVQVRLRGNVPYIEILANNSFDYVDSVDAYTSNPNAIITAGSWCHLAMTVDTAGNFKLYVDGLLSVSFQFSTHTTFTSKVEVYIGDPIYNSNASGAYALFGIYNIVLAQADITQLKNGSPPPSIQAPNLKSYPVFSSYPTITDTYISGTWQSIIPGTIPITLTTALIIPTSPQVARGLSASILTRCQVPVSTPRALRNTTDRINTGAATVATAQVQHNASSLLAVAIKSTTIATPQSLRNATEAITTQLVTIPIAKANRNATDAIAIHSLTVATPRWMRLLTANISTKALSTATAKATYNATTIIATKVTSTTVPIAIHNASIAILTKTASGEAPAVWRRGAATSLAPHITTTATPRWSRLLTTAISTRTTLVEADMLLSRSSVAIATRSTLFAVGTTQAISVGILTHATLVALGSVIHKASSAIIGKTTVTMLAQVKMQGTSAILTRCQMLLPSKVIHNASAGITTRSGTAASGREARMLTALIQMGSTTAGVERILRIANSTIHTGTTAIATPQWLRVLGMSAQLGVSIVNAATVLRNADTIVQSGSQTVNEDQVLLSAIAQLFTGTSMVVTGKFLADYNCAIRTSTRLLALPTVVFFGGHITTVDRLLKGQLDKLGPRGTVQILP